jgi:hypothetical protein
MSLGRRSTSRSWRWLSTLFKMSSCLGICLLVLQSEMNVAFPLKNVSRDVFVLCWIVILVYFTIRFGCLYFSKLYPENRVWTMVSSDGSWFGLPLNMNISVLFSWPTRVSWSCCSHTTYELEHFVCCYQDSLPMIDWGVSLLLPIIWENFSHADLPLQITLVFNGLAGQ